MTRTKTFAKDPKAPKRSQSAYFLFLAEKRAEMMNEIGRDENGKLAGGIGAVGKLGGAKWKALAEEERQPYLERAAALKAEYTAKREAYVATDDFKAYQAAKKEFVKSQKAARLSKRRTVTVKKPASWPKKPLIGYMLFLKANRAEFVAEVGSGKVTEITKMAGAKWSALSAEAKQPYLAEAAENKLAYNQVMEEFKQTEDYRTYQEQVAAAKQADPVLLQRKKAIDMLRSKNKAANEKLRSKKMAAVEKAKKKATKEKLRSKKKAAAEKLVIKKKAAKLKLRSKKKAATEKLRSKKKAATEKLRSKKKAAGEKAKAQKKIKAQKLRSKKKAAGEKLRAKNKIAAQKLRSKKKAAAGALKKKAAAEKLRSKKKAGAAKKKAQKLAAKKKAQAKSQKLREQKKIATQKRRSQKKKAQLLRSKKKAAAQKARSKKKAASAKKKAADAKRRSKKKAASARKKALAEKRRARKAKKARRTTRKPSRKSSRKSKSRRSKSKSSKRSRSRKSRRSKRRGRKRGRRSLRTVWQVDTPAASDDYESNTPPGSIIVPQEEPVIEDVRIQDVSQEREEETGSLDAADTTHESEANMKAQIQSYINSFPRAQ